MSERGTQLLETATGQIDELIGLISTRGGAALRVPCRGREKLGDGTVAACALHTADNYHRIAGFLQGQSDGWHHQIARSVHGHGESKHGGDYAADTDTPLDPLSRPEHPRLRLHLRQVEPSVSSSGYAAR